MKNEVRTMISILVICVSLASCKNKINPAMITSFTNENIILKQKVTDMKTFKYQIFSERENKYSEMISAIDPKKKALYKKENTLKSEINTLKEKMDKIAKEYEGNYSSLTNIIESNKNFIGAIPYSEQNEEAIKLDWQQNVAVYNGIAEQNIDLQKEMISLSKRHNELTKQVVKKYGKAGTAKNNVKKKKK